MKSVFIGDVHGEDLWKRVIDQEKDADLFVFIGDYFDSFAIPGLIQMHNFKEIVQFKEQSSSEVVMLVGNHDYHYFPEIGDTGTSGFQKRMFTSISGLLEENRRHLKMAHSFEDVLCTHAGVSEVFMDSVYGKDGWEVKEIVEELNDLFKYKPKSFRYSDYDFSYTGDHASQSPIWIRPNSLMRSSQEIRKSYKQVVGHTIMKDLSIEDLNKWTGGKYFFIDTLNSAHKYLVKIDDTFYDKQLQS